MLLNNYCVFCLSLVLLLHLGIPRNGKKNCKAPFTPKRNAATPAAPCLFFFSFLVWFVAHFWSGNIHLNETPSAPVTRMYQRSVCAKFWHRVRRVWLVVFATLLDNHSEIAPHLGCYLEIRSSQTHLVFCLDSGIRGRIN